MKNSLYYLGVDLGLLLIIIIPATALVLWVAYHYRRGRNGTYQPNFIRSHVMEGFIWGVPVLLVGALSYFAVQGAEDLDPYHPDVVQQYVATYRNFMPAKNFNTLRINVITTDWQWLFIYPKQGVALANKLVIPANRPITLYLTSASVTNDFYIQKLVGQIYIMPGMRTKRSFLVQRPGVYNGYSAQLSGAGYAWMRYKAHIVTQQHFRQWLRKAKSSELKLTYDRFRRFAQPTINTTPNIITFSGIQPHLFHMVIHRVKDGRLTHYRPKHIGDHIERYSAGNKKQES